MTRLRELASIVVDSEKEDAVSESELVSRLEKLSSTPLPELEIDQGQPTKDSKSVKYKIDQVVLKHIKGVCFQCI